MRLKKNVFKWSLKNRLLTLCGLMSLVGIFAFISSETGHKTLEWVKTTNAAVNEKSNLQVNQVDIVWDTETHHTTRADIKNALGVEQGMPMKELDLQQLRSNTEKLPWVRSCVIERYLPDKIKVTIKEKTPIAIWQNNKKYHPLDELGHPIQTDKKMPSDLLLVVGEKAPEHLLNLLSALETVPEIYQYVRSAVWVGDRRWNLKLFDAEKGIEVILPEGEDLIRALKRLNATEKQEKLIKRKIKSVDMRQKDKIILRPLTETKKETSSKGKKKK